MARGIIRGAAEHYRETVIVVERSCMLRGADACRISVRQQPS